MKKFVKSLSVLMIFAMMLTLVPKYEASAATKYALAAKSKTLFVGGCTGTKANGTKASFKKTYTIKVNGLKKTDKVTYKSSNKNIAKVSTKGKVTAVSCGKATISVKVKTKAGKTYTRKFTATVKANAATVNFTGVTEGQEFTVSDKTYTLTAEALSANGTKSTDLVEFLIDDEYSKIATVTKDGALKVKAAGDFVVRARAYQSASYTGTTAVAELKLTAKAAKNEFAARQISASKVELTVPEAVKTVAKTDVKVTTMNGAATMNVDIRDVSVSATDDTKVIVELWNQLTAGTEYTFTYGGESAKVVGASLQPKDAATIEVLTKQVVIGTYTTLEYKVYTADGIEIGDQSSLSTYVTFELAPELGDIDANAKIQLINKGNAPVKLTYKVPYVNEKTYKPEDTLIVKDFVVTGVDKAAVTVKSIEYTVGATSSTVFDNKAYTPVHQVAVDDDSLGRNTDLVFRIRYSDDTVVTNDSTLFDYDCNDSTKIIVAGKTLKPINPGTATILVYEAGTKTLVTTCEITVVAARKPVSVTVKASKNNINTMLPSDQVVITAKVLDNSGANFPEASVELVEVNKNGTAAFNAAGVTDTIVGDQHVLTAKVGSAITGKGDIILKAVAKYGATTLESAPIAIKCDEVDPASTPDSVKLSVENNAGTATADTTIVSGKTYADYKLSVKSCSYKGLYQISDKLAVKFNDPANYSANTTEYFYEVNLGTKKLTNQAGYSDNFANGEICVLSDKSNEISKLAAGTYTVSLFKITTDGSSKVTKQEKVTTATFTVSDNQPKLSVSQNKNAISSMDEATIKSEAAVTVVYNSTPSVVLLSSTVPADSNLSFTLTTGSSALYIKSVSYKLFLDGSKYITISQELGYSLTKK